MALTFDKPTPLADAVKRISGKTPIGAVLKSADWARVPLELRERAFFSATIECAEFLQAAQRGVLQMAQMARRTMADGGEGAYQGRAALIADLMALAEAKGLAPQDPSKRGTLEDITSLRRLELVVDFNTVQASEFAHWKMDQDPDLLDAYPCQELVRIESRVEVRGGDPDAKGVGAHWRRLWAELGGKFYGGRMIARKNDAIWRRLSRFQTPFPPFDFGSGIGLDDVSREEAEELGVIAVDEVIESAEAGFNDELSASVDNLSPKMKGALDLIFGDQVRIANGRAEWSAQTEEAA